MAQVFALRKNTFFQEIFIGYSFARAGQIYMLPLTYGD